MTIKLIGFDLDDTLWPMKPTLFNAEIQLDKWLQINCPSLSYNVESMRPFGKQLLAGDPGLAADLSELRTRVIEQALLASDYAPNEAETLSKLAFQQFHEARNNVTYFEGALEALGHLSSHYSLASLTNGNADTIKLGLHKYFSFALSAADVGSPKPAPDLFETALSRQGIEPNEMIYVGDHPEHDIEPANQLGIFTVWVNMQNRNHDWSSPPTVEIGSLSELSSAVSRIETLSD